MKTILRSGFFFHLKWLELNKTEKRNVINLEIWNLLDPQPQWQLLEHSSLSFPICSFSRYDPGRIPAQGHRINGQSPAWPHFAFSRRLRPLSKYLWASNLPQNSRERLQTSPLCYFVMLDKCANTHGRSRQLHQDDESCGGLAAPSQPIGISCRYPAESPCGQLCLSP